MRQLAPALLLLLGLAGCGTTVGPGAPAQPAVPSDTSSGACPRSITLTESDAGAARCVALGGTVILTLHNQAGQAWAAPQLSATQVLSPPAVATPADALTATYNAVGPGSVDITSARSACPPPSPGSAGCHAQQGWRTTVTVR